MHKQGTQVVKLFGVVEMKTAKKGDKIMNVITWKYVKELQNEKAIDEFEKKHNFSYPQDLKQILINFNGGRPSSKYYDLANEKDKEFKTLLSFNETDIENVYKCYPLDSSDKSLIPFASDPAGNYFVLKDNEIYLWNHETDYLSKISSTFTDFLNSLHD